MSFKNNLKNIIYFGLNSGFGHFPVRKASILMYHSVDCNEVFFTVRPEDFKKQMDYLHENDYKVVSLSRLVEHIFARNIPPKTVVLTFDDGYEDNYLNAFPVLKKYGFPATIFLAAGFMGGKIPNCRGIPLKALDWSQIREMAGSGLIEFEPHTMTHPKLSKVPAEQAEKEILESKSLIENKLNKKCSLFAYPNGNFNQEVQSILKNNGFSAAVGTDAEGLVSCGTELFNLKRNSIDSSMNHTQFRAKLGLPVHIFSFLRNMFFKNGTA